MCRVYQLRAVLNDLENIPFEKKKIREFYLDNWKGIESNNRHLLDMKF